MNKTYGTQLKKQEQTHKYLIMLSVKQGGIKYHFLSLWYDSTWDWTSVYQPLANTLTNSGGVMISKLD